MPDTAPFQAQQPIGIFDSGIGGLTVANAVIKHLPNENIIYFGDTAHLPYGDKSVDAIRYYSLQIVRFLIKKGCKLIIVACNSAATAAYDVLVDFFEGQALFANVVDPLVENVAAEPFRRVGVIATKATISTGAYERALRQARAELSVASLATPLLVPMIEEGFFHNNISHAIISTYLDDPQLAGIDALLLACTHYPLIRPEIEAHYGGQVRVFDSSQVLALRVEQILGEAGLLNTQRQQPPHFYVSDYTRSFEETTRLFYGEQIHLEHLPLWT